MDGIAATRCAALLAGVLSVTLHATALHLLAPGSAGPRAGGVGPTTLQLVTRIVEPVPPPVAPILPPPLAAEPARPASQRPVEQREIVPSPELRPVPVMPPEPSARVEPAAETACESGPTIEAADVEPEVPSPARPIGGGVNRPPDYPARAIARGWEGEVTLRVEVLASGHAGEVTMETSSGHDILDRAACVAVSAWRFEPARRDGIAVRSTFLQPIEFRLER
ncbi:MAG: energy transducer TonB [Planctomycetota bacterium]|jgi:protein TonB